MSILSVIVATISLIAHVWILTGEAYSRVARTYAERNTAAAIQVIESARSSLPWQDASLAKQATEWQLFHNAQTATETFKLALGVRPIDPYLWSRFSVAAFYAGDFRSGEAAALRALDLAPNTLAIALEQSAVGGQFLGQVSPELVHAWEKAAEFAMSSGASTTKLYLLKNRRETDFCRLISRDSPTRDWCHFAEALRNHCDSSDVRNPSVAARCMRLGFLPK